MIVHNVAGNLRTPRVLYNLQVIMRFSLIYESIFIPSRISSSRVQGKSLEALYQLRYKGTNHGPPFVGVSPS